MRPLACVRFIHTHGKIPHMQYRRNLNEIELPASLREEIEKMLKQKETAAEGHLMSQNKALLDYFREESVWAEQWLGGLQHEKNRDYEFANKVFRRIIEAVNANG